MKIYSDSLHKIDGYPDKDLQRRSCGYAIDEAIEVVNDDPGLAICRLLAGSEGTLARKIVYNNTTMMGKLIGEDNPLVGIEPSAILTFRDEYPDLVPADKRKETRRFVDHCLLYDDLLSVRLWPDQRVSPCSWQHLGHHAGSRYWTERESGQSTR